MARKVLRKCVHAPIGSNWLQLANTYAEQEFISLAEAQDTPFSLSKI